MYKISAPEPSLQKVVTTSHVNESTSSPTTPFDFDPVFTQDEQCKIIRRIDRRLVATCGIMYWVSLLDRTNLSVAAIAGMLRDLEMTGYRYNVVVLVFFITFVLFQPLAIVICRKTGPRLFLTSIVFAWGVLTVCL